MMLFYRLYYFCFIGYITFKCLFGLLNLLAIIVVYYSSRSIGIRDYYLDFL